MNALLTETNVGNCDKLERKFKSCLFALYNHKQGSERERKGYACLSQQQYTVHCVLTLRCSSSAQCKAQTGIFPASYSPILSIKTASFLF